MRWQMALDVQPADVRRPRSSSIASPEVETVTAQSQFAKLIAELHQAVAEYTDGIPQEVLSSLRGRVQVLMDLSDPELADKKGNLSEALALAEKHALADSAPEAAEVVEKVDAAPFHEDISEVVLSGPKEEPKKPSHCCRNTMFVVAATGVAVAATVLGSPYVREYLGMK
jgi:hypothetical protein